MRSALPLVALAVFAPAARAAPTAPAPTIVSPANGATVAGGDITVTVRPPAGARVEVKKALVDGKPVETKSPDGRGILLPGSPGNTGSPASPDDKDLVKLLVPLPVSAGNYTIELQFSSGATAKVRVQVVPPPPPGPTRSRLVMLTIGVSKYADADLTLLYPAKDARDIAEVFTGQAGLLYSEVKTRVLTDQSADKTAILDALEWLQKETTARDVAVLFLAGHGIRDGATGVYYYLPFNANRDAVKSTMVSAQDIRSTLRALPGKVVVFLDTCFSGSLFAGKERGTPDLDAFVQDLMQTENGVVVFTSTTKQQTARESREWNNGVFTKAVVEGLAGKAKTDDGPGVTINTLSAFVSDRVKDLTGGTQTPMLAMPKGVADFPIAIATEARGELPPDPVPATPPPPVPAPDTAT